MHEQRTNPLSYAAHARLRVLLAPLLPLRRAKYQELSDLVRQINDVRFEDINVESPDESSETSELRSQRKICLIDPDYLNPKLLPSGRLIIDFVSDVDKEHEYLESFELSRRVFAVCALT